MARQSHFDHQGWFLNFSGQPYLESIADYADPFALLEYENFDASELRAQNEIPILHEPISAGMDFLLSNDSFMLPQQLNLPKPNLLEMNTSDSVNVTLLYEMGYKFESRTTSSLSGQATSFNTAQFPSSLVQGTCPPGPSLPRRPKRERMEDYQLEFMGPQPVQTEKRRRQPYQTERRMEVGLVRQLGACIRCKIMKTSCSPGRPCLRCSKHCGDPYFSQALCVREKLLDVRLNPRKPGNGSIKFV